MKTALLVFAFCVAPCSAADSDLSARVEREMPALAAIYKDFHQNPELSGAETRTAAALAGELRKAGYAVEENIGRYADGRAAAGVAAVLKNGAGPVVMVRTELDALPVEERTGLPYASRARARNAAGQEVAVMHACGHDLHMSSVVGAARVLAGLKDRWKGTLIFIGQPSEETGSGARAMLADRLYERFGRPDFVVALHDDPYIEAGRIAVAPGPVMASSTSLEVVMRGMGGHGALPETTKDPIVMAAQFVLAAQTIVSRQNSPLDPAVVTIGSIHGGTKHNIIPDEVTLQFSVRTFSDEARKRILAAISRAARGVALAAGVPEDRAPLMKVNEGEAVPVTYNDAALVARLKPAFAAALGEHAVLEGKPEMVSEDFGLFGLEGRKIPTVLFRLGVTEGEKLRGGSAPSLHSPLFYPALEPSLRTGVAATAAAVLELMKSGR